MGISHRECQVCGNPFNIASEEADQTCAEHRGMMVRPFGAWGNMGTARPNRLIERNMQGLFYPGNHENRLPLGRQENVVVEGGGHALRDVVNRYRYALVGEDTPIDNLATGGALTHETIQRALDYDPARIAAEDAPPYRTATEVNHAYQRYAIGYDYGTGIDGDQLPRADREAYQRAIAEAERLAEEGIFNEMELGRGEVHPNYRPFLEGEYDAEGEDEDDEDEDEDTGEEFEALYDDTTLRGPEIAYALMDEQGQMLAQGRANLPGAYPQYRQPPTGEPPTIDPSDLDGSLAALVNHYNTHYLDRVLSLSICPIHYRRLIAERVRRGLTVPDPVSIGGVPVRVSDGASLVHIEVEFERFVHAIEVRQEYIF